ncbi:MAG: hypothetical protein JNL52_10070, partial [Flavobacteriales bacterium]|nr:hypothetical protein [Flavobacteriales bacterium]
PSFVVVIADTLWSGADTTLTLNNGQCAVLQITGYFTAFGNFTNTVTLDPDTTAAGDELNASADVSLESACPASTIILNGALASSGYTYLTGSVNILGDFLVDADVLFFNAQVYLSAGARIVVLNEADVNSITSSFIACDSVMWKGISVGNGSIANLYASLLADAETGIEATDGATVIISGCDFRNNRVDVGVPPNTVFNSVSLLAQNTVFHAEGPLAAPYTGQTTVLGTQGYAAFDVNDMALDLTGIANVIHHKSNGVVGTRCDVHVANCSMRDIQPDPAYVLVGNGAGINCSGPQGWFTLKQTGFGAGIGAAPSFKDCYWGIYTRYMNVRSSENFMNNVGTAYRVEKSGYRDVDIQNNRLDTRRDGIVLNMNDGAAYLLVQFNDITFAQDPPPGQYNKGYYAIRVNEANTLNLDSKIQNNTIRYRLGAYSARGGIWLVSARRYLVANNTLLMTDNASNRVGILLNGCTEPDVKCNDIHGATNGYLELGQASVRSFGGTTPLFSCNRMDRTTNGMLFSGWTVAEVRGNEISNHKYGLHLEQNAIIGPQNHRGNLWLQPAQVWGAWCETASIADQSVIAVDPGAAYNTPTSSSPPGFIFPQSGTTFSCYDGLGECVGYKERCVGCGNEIYQAVVDSSLENGVYTDETRWSLKGELYEVLKSDSTMLEDPAMQAFYSAVQSTVIGALKDVDEERIALFDMDSTIVVQLQQNREQLLVLQGELKLALGDLSAPGLTEAQKTFLLGAIQGLQQNIGELIAFNTHALTLAADSRVLSAEGVKNTNAMLGATELTETNSKTVNEIYLNTVAKDVDEFTVQQTDNLFEVANQCPLLGGDAVFMARALYYLIDPEQEFDDPALCLQQGLITKNLKEGPNERLSIVPNPTNGKATLVLSTPLVYGGQLFMYGAMGSEIFNKRLPSDQLRIELDLSGLASGVYHFRVRSALGDEGDGRLIISR